MLKTSVYKAPNKEVNYFRIFFLKKPFFSENVTEKLSLK